MKVTGRGQVTIPKELRDALGIVAGTEVTFTRRGDELMVTVVDAPRGDGHRIAERLRARGDGALSTDEILAMTRGG